MKHFFMKIMHIFLKEMLPIVFNATYYFNFVLVYAINF